MVEESKAELSIEARKEDSAGPVDNVAVGIGGELYIASREGETFVGLNSEPSGFPDVSLDTGSSFIFILFLSGL